jgi:hypothetical protein
MQAAAPKPGDAGYMPSSCQYTDGKMKGNLQQVEHWVFLHILFWRGKAGNTEEVVDAVRGRAGQFCQVGFPQRLLDVRQLVAWLPDAIAS